MLRRIKLTLVGVVALAAIAAGTSDAATIHIEPGGNFTSVSLGRMTFTGGSINIRCSVTMTGTLVREAAATRGTHIGSTRTVEWAGCEGGNLKAFNSLPYELSFNSLTASGIEFEMSHVSLTLAVTIFGIVVECTYGGNVPMLAEVTNSRTGLIRLLTNMLTRSGGSSSCPSGISWSGSASLNPSMTITLTEA